MKWSLNNFLSFQITCAAVLLGHSRIYLCMYLLSQGGFPGGSDGKEPACNIGDPGFDPWVREYPPEKGMATHSSILAGEFHGQRVPAGYSPWGCKESDTTE